MKDAARGEAPATTAREDAFVAGIVFLLAASWLLLFSGGMPDINPDGANALHMARNVLAGDGLSMRVVPLEDAAPAASPMITKPPVYALSIAALAKLGLDARYAAWGIVIVAWALAVTMLYLLGRQVLPSRVALLVPLLFGCQVTTLRWGISIHEQSLLVCLSYVVLWRLSRLETYVACSSSVPMGLTGVLAGLAMATSYQGLPLLIVATACVASLAASLKRWRAFVAYCGGVALVGAWPLARFIGLLLDGVRPAFTGSESATHHRILAGIASAFQNDFMGRQLVWLYGESLLHLLVLALFLLAVCGLAAYVARVNRGWRPLALFLIVYMAMLVGFLGGRGTGVYEPRVGVVSNGLLLLFLVFLVHRTLVRSGMRGGARFACGAAVTALFLSAQYSRMPELLSSRSALCPAPQTMGWLREHLPKDSVVAVTQCGFELVADTADYYIVFIPPADSYSMSVARWEAGDLARLCRMSARPWVVILDGGKGGTRDPLLDRWGYGRMVDGLFRGESPNGVRLAARLDDGFVYGVRCEGS
ncbi:MAG: hypothetical protein JSS47_24450 [Proteobacteria bacterium]|nr:hypothetical protein [Pseudomonadota bacterium]